MNARFAMLATLLLCLATAGPAKAACDEASFGAAKAGICNREDCTPTFPPEILKIRRGIVSKYQGLFVNDGAGRWIAIDIGTNQVIVIHVFGGKYLPEASRKLRSMKPTDKSYGRRRTTGSVDLIELVTIKPLPPQRKAALICEANTLWTQDTGLPSNVTDILEELHLVDDGISKSFGGPGGLKGPAHDLAEKLRQIAGNPD